MYPVTLLDEYLRPDSERARVATELGDQGQRQGEEQSGPEEQQSPAGQDGEGECTLGDALPGPGVREPSVMVISTEELQSLVFCLGTGLSSLEADALRLYLEGASYEEMAERLGCDTKTIDNALQRVKRKIITHQKAREVLQ